jgi:signal transduction histidine kinase
MPIANIFVLTPRWIEFDQFWISLKKRNLWLIQLRYAAVALLTGLILLGTLIANIRIATVPLAIVSGTILLYNFILHKAHQYLPAAHAPFHGLHFALIQICLDFLTLALLIYFTGGVESPFLIISIFHVIIGSLILPAATVTLICCALLTIMFAAALCEYHGMIQHYAITGLFATPLYTNLAYIVAQFAMISVTMFISNFLANSISKELYLRERSLTRAYGKLEEAEKTKSRYVMSVVHDLKTPIAAVITYLNMILERSFGDITEELERPLERSRFRLNGAITLINDILQLSQVKLASRLDIAHINLTLLVDEIYQEMRILFMAKHIRFSTWVNAADDVAVDAEPKLLKLALSNLMSNAQKYTPEDGIVEVHIKEFEDTVRIEIADSGVGIPEDEKSKIFQDFYRTSVSKKSGIEGTGLGLSIVQQIVQQLHGTISFESPSRLQIDDTHRGTAFILELPKKYEQRPQDYDEDIAEE